MILRTFLCVAAVAWMVTPGALLVGQEPSRDGLVMERPKSGEEKGDAPQFNGKHKH